MEKTSHLARGGCINWIKLDNQLKMGICKWLNKCLKQTITTYKKWDGPPSSMEIAWFFVGIHSE